MTPAKVLAQVKDIGGGLSLNATGDGLRNNPHGAGAVLREVRHHRAEIVALLQSGENLPQPTDDPDRRALIEKCGQTNPIAIACLRQWFGEECVVASRFSSSLFALRRHFHHWVGLQENAGTRDAFAAQLRIMGFDTDVYDMVAGLSLASDFIAARVYECIQTGFPDDVRYFNTGGIFMPLIISSKKTQYEVPEEGEHLAVLADVVDLGSLPSQYGPKEKIRFTWLVEQRSKDGNYMLVFNRYTRSLHEKSHLRKDIKNILGKDCGDTFDVEKLIGTNARLVISHNQSEGRTYANIAAILRVRKGDKVLTVPPDFKRAETGKNGNDGGGHSQNIHGVDVTDEDLPQFSEK